MRLKKITFALFLIACILLSACSESVNEIKTEDISPAGILNNGALYITVGNESYVYTKSISANKDACGDLITSFDAERVYKSNGCDDMSCVILASSNGEYKEYSFASDKKHFTREENELRAIADAEILARYPETDFADFYIAVDINEDGSATVEYNLLLGGYISNYEYQLSLSSDKESVDFHVSGEEYIGFLGKFGPRDVKAAELRLEPRMKEYDEKASGYHLSLDNNGNLCIGREIIVDSFSLFNDYDHKHIFVVEILCYK